MKKKKNNLRKINFSIELLIVFFIALLSVSGIHVGLIVLATQKGWNDTLQILIPILYWGLIALGLTIYTGMRVHKAYAKPIEIMAKATSKVANGDFSVFIPPQNTTDKIDYIDTMFSDFNKMVEELGSIETLKTDFFSNVSHEIKTPLSVIQNNAELLKSDTITEGQRTQCIENILHATKRLSGLITNMLKLNKLEKQVIKPKPEPYDLCIQLCDCALQFENQWEKKDIEFIADMEDRAMIKADAELLEIVWTNLLSNALKFTPSGGTITITQTSDEEKVTVSVMDTGFGMDSQTQKRIFDKFYQGDTSHSTEGNGLGLALVLRILELSEGTITVKSELGKGTNFTVTLPISMNDEGAVN